MSHSQYFWRPISTAGSFPDIPWNKEARTVHYKISFLYYLNLIWDTNACLCLFIRLNNASPCTYFFVFWAGLITVYGSTFNIACAYRKTKKHVFLYRFQSCHNSKWKYILLRGQSKSLQVSIAVFVCSRHFTFESYYWPNIRNINRAKGARTNIWSYWAVCAKIVVFRA